VGFIGIGSKLGYIAGRAIAGGGKKTSAAATKKLAAQKAAFLKAHGIAVKSTTVKASLPVHTKIAVAVGKTLIYTGSVIAGLIASQWR
jgi:hypothetical protein